MLKHLIPFALLFILSSFFTVSAVAQESSDKPTTFKEKRIEDFSVELLTRNVNNAEMIEVSVTALENDLRDFGVNGIRDFKINDEEIQLTFFSGIARYPVKETTGVFFVKYMEKERIPNANGERIVHSKSKMMRFYESGGSISKPKKIPMWWSILPPLLAIGLAMVFKEVLVSLFTGIWLGALITFNFDVRYLFTSLWRVVDKYILHSISNPDHVAVIVFSVLIGGTVAIISKNGGMAGVVQKLSKLANSSQNSLFVTWALGIAIFFDDYANTLIVGNTMRSVTDKYKVSREKLAYVVDATAAPVSAVALITTWIGAELGYISQQVEALSLEESAYSIFLNSLQFAYYPILTLIFIFLIIRLKRDYGPMHTAEVRARLTGKLYNAANDEDESAADELKALDPVKGIRFKWTNAFFPIISIILVTVIGLAITGYNAAGWKGDNFFNKLSNLIGNADSYSALLLGSMTGVMVAILMSVTSKTLKFKRSMETAVSGFKTMLPAVVVLVLAWSLAALTEELHTADYLTSIFGDVPAQWMPLITFIMAGVIAFSTGSSWSTMAILYPIILPTTYFLGVSSGMHTADIMPIIYNVTATVLAGSVFGDHCSPISDTTVLSSLATQCNHIDHVRTQMPYALTVGAVSILLGGVFFAFGIPVWINYIVGLGLIFVIIRFVGKSVPVEGKTMAEEVG